MISACIIVGDDRNDELLKCLDSVQSCVDEIIVVHTGLSKITRKLIERYATLIITKKWDNNFSEVKNTAISKATGKWILFLDSDEFITNPDNLIGLDELDGKSYLLNWINIDQQGKEIYTGLAHRLFRSNEGFRYIGFVHEQLCDNRGEKVLPDGKFLGCEIIHTGYSCERIRLKKFVRNRELIKKNIKMKPEDKINYYYLQRSYYNQARYNSLENKRLDQNSCSLLEKSKNAYFRYKSLKGSCCFDKEAKKMEELTESILLFKDQPGIEVIFQNNE